MAGGTTTYDYHSTAKESVSMSVPDRRAYVRIADELRGQIADGRLSAGEMVPPINKLRLDSGCSRQPVGRSLRLLEHEGLITRVPGIGYYVCSRPGEPGGDMVSCPVTQAASMVVGELAGVTAEQSEAVSLLVRELVRGNPLAVAWLDLTDAMLKARCPRCAGPMPP
jgi:DNA-binding transcriptional MocR family regulator